jgi:A/G-specific adenine glycosylase
MWEFPNSRVEGDPVKGLVNGLKMGYELRVRDKEALKVVKHAYTHFRITVYPFICDLVSMSGNATLQWVPINKLGEYPMGKIDRQIARQVEKQTFK